MFPPEVFAERRQLSDMIAALPPEVLKDNAAALLNLLKEFQRSLSLELRVIGSVEELDVGDATAVTTLYRDFKRYVNDRTFDLERTRCSQIRRIYDQQIEVRRRGEGSFDPYIGYELGINLLKGRLTRDHTDFPTLLVYEQRLGENIRAAQYFGDDATRRAERNQIIAYLNDLALADLGVSFNDLCSEAMAAPITLPPAQEQALQALAHYVDRFRHADDEFIETMDNVTNDALAALSRINQAVTAGDLTTARQEHAAFVATYEPELGRARETIRAMSDTGNQLIDLLAS